jgi:hypothetical protein
MQNKKSLTRIALIFVCIGLVLAAAYDFVSWLQMRSVTKLFVNPIPSNLQVYQTHSVLFASYIHYSAPPEVIAAIIQSHQLASPTNDSPDQIE